MCTFGVLGLLCEAPATAEITAMIETISFLGPRGPVTHDEQSRIFSFHTCRLFLSGHDPIRSLASQQSMIRVRHRLQLTMWHVYGYSGNLGYEYADHAAALGTSEFISSHKVTSCCIPHNFDASVCFDGCNNINEIYERLQQIRANTAFLKCVSLALSPFVFAF